MRQVPEVAMGRCRRLAELCFERYCRNLYEPLYLVGTQRPCLDTHNPRLPIWEHLTVATAAEEESGAFIIVRPEPLPRHLTIEHLADFIRDWLKTEPIWCYAD